MSLLNTRNKKVGSMKFSLVICLVVLWLLFVKGDEHLLTDYIQDFSDKEKIYDNFVSDYVKSLNITDWLNVLVLEAPKADPDLDQVKKYITLLMGEAPPDAGEYSKDGIYSGLSQAYRIRMIADPKWNMLNYFAKTLDEYEDNVYDTMRGIYKTLTFDVSYCDSLRKEKFEKWESAKDKDDPLSFIKQLKAASELDDNITEHCLNHPGAAQLAFSKDLTSTTLELYRDSLALVCLTFDISLNFDVWPVNGRKANPTGKIPHAHFRRMLEEGAAIELEIQKNMDEWYFNIRNRMPRGTEQKKAAAKWQSIVDTLLDDPTYKGLFYFEDIRSRKKYFENLRNISKLRHDVGECYDYFKKVDCFCEAGIYKNISKFREEYIETLKHNLTRLITDEIWPGMKVAIKDQTKTSKGRWIYDNTNAFQRIRAAWTYLDGINEYIKCELKKSYWIDLREEALKTTQIKLEEATLFTYFSKTLYQPCKTNDTDLIGSCTLQNHEVCRSVIPSEAHQLHMDESGDNSYLKPKTTTRIEKSGDNEERKCKSEITYVMPFQICRCGFRMGCKSNLPKQHNPTVCALIPNDNIRRQCRGNLGYPCYSQPLAPKMYDESCATGYCNILKDSCAQPPYNKFPKVKGERF